MEKAFSLVLISALLFVVSFPDFNLWQAAWFGLVPFLLVIDELRTNLRIVFLLGWIWGITFFFGSCWWLTHSLINYGGIPTMIAYSLIFIGAIIVGVFIALFALLQAILLNKFNERAILVAPFLWISLEFLRFWVAGNNWNAIAYSQAFVPEIARFASIGGIYLVGFLVVAFNACLAILLRSFIRHRCLDVLPAALLFVIAILIFAGFVPKDFHHEDKPVAVAIVLQPNVPMSGLDKEKWEELKRKHVKMTEEALASENISKGLPRIVIFPESPMNFAYGKDKNLQEFFRDFTKRNQISLLFNSAEPNTKQDNFFNSAVMINENGEKVGQYNKVFLVPFGEYAPVPAFVRDYIPTLVGNFAFGNEISPIPFGLTKAGIMICFESHFPNLSRKYAQKGVDLLVEMTNDGYLGKTPVLKQHLANAVFRAIETGLPVVRATNVGITAYITENGEVLDEAPVYTDAVRVWTIKKTNSQKTFYVKYGDWLPIFSFIITIISIVVRKRYGCK